MAFFASNKNTESASDMPFLQHLEELRWHLVRSVVVVVLLAIGAFCLNDFVFDTVIFGPLQQDFISYRTLCAIGHKMGVGDIMCLTLREPHLQTLSASEQFFNHMWISFLCGLILGFPFILWELWKFVKPALKNKEVGPVKIFVVIASVLFLIGIFFGYFLLFPMSYISLISTMTLVSGIIFEMPILVYFLTRMTLLTPQFMRKYRKHAVVVILIVAAVITPSPDVTSQMVVGIPMYLLYEISVFVSAWAVKKHQLDK
jgi:sec-independent protein translocase protein TatC